MPGAEFLDTNVLVYAYDASSPDKRRVAQKLVTRAVAGDYVISTQVLAEFPATLPPQTRARTFLKRPGCHSGCAGTYTADHTPTPTSIWCVVPSRARSAYGINFCDPLIVAAPERAGSAEDLVRGPESGSNLLRYGSPKSLLPEADARVRSQDVFWKANASSIMRAHSSTIFSSSVEFSHQILKHLNKEF